MFLIRADGNAVIGAGHLMRCVSIAQELRRGGSALEQVVFVCADQASADMARRHGFDSFCLGTDYRDMESELPVWRKLWVRLWGSKGGKRPGILVDSYYVTDAYLAGLKSFGFVILMDDMGRRCFPVDCVVNYNAPAGQAAYEKLYKGRSTRLLVGSSYIPLRPQFREARERLAVQKEEKERAAGSRAARILITTGGGDVSNIAGKILKAVYRPELEFDLVVGRFSPHFQEMKALEEQVEGVHILHDVEDMAGLMLEADVALTAGGSTVYELAVLGVPFICFSYAENQEQLVDYIGKNKIADSAGAWHRDSAGTLERIQLQLGELVEDAQKRGQYSRNEMAVVDGRGSERLAAALRTVVLAEK